MLSFPCPACGMAVSAPATSAGRIAICATCKQLVTVPLPGAASSLAMPGGVTAAVPSRPAPVAPAAEPPSQGGGLLLVLFAAAALLMLVAGGAVAYVLLASPVGGEKSPEVAHHHPHPAANPNKPDDQQGRLASSSGAETKKAEGKQSGAGSPPLIGADGNVPADKPRPVKPATGEKTGLKTDGERPKSDEKKGVEKEQPYAYKRRKETSTDELSKELQRAREVGLDQPAAKLLYTLIQPNGGGRRGGPAPILLPDHGPRFLKEIARVQKTPEILCFPWLLGSDCQMTKESADNLNDLSGKLRTCLQQSVPAGSKRPDADKVRTFLTSDSTARDWQQTAGLPTLLQMLQAENTPLRQLLVEQLTRVPGQQATTALAQRAIFDLSAEVREKAVEALRNRPAGAYRQVLLAGLRYPWSPVADHAAEALSALKDREAVPALVALLKEPDPTMPFTVRDNGKDVLVLRELVRLNHLSNCMLCHAPSTSRDDLVRGRVPMPGEDPPPLYYAATSGLFVRADITYLRQDFSVVQPVTNAGKWPGSQRYDYLVRMRPVRPDEKALYLKIKDKPAATYEQKEAVLFALRGITGKNPGSSHDDWKSVRDAAIEAGKRKSDS